jgi:predicted nucleic acid-binding Zn ribbon protein
MDPEVREHREIRYEKNKFSREKEKKLLKILDEGKETFPDIIQCPNQKCGNVLTVQKLSDSILLMCKNCGWESVLKRELKIMIFTEGTILMHKSAIGCSREKAVAQVMTGEPSVGKYSEYVPIGGAVEKIKSWVANGATIIYLTSRKGEEVKEIKSVLDRYNFSDGQLESRQECEEYKDVVERIAPDVLIEDDCESVGGASEMCHPNLRSNFQSEIKSIVVKEFEGIDCLSENPTGL